MKIALLTELRIFWLQRGKSPPCKKEGSRYDTKLLGGGVRFNFWCSRERGTPLHCHPEVFLKMPGARTHLKKALCRICPFGWGEQQIALHCHYYLVHSDSFSSRPISKLLVLDKNKWKHITFCKQMIIVKSSSSCRAASSDIPDPLSPLIPILHRLWQVFRATSRILT